MTGLALLTSGYALAQNPQLETLVVTASRRDQPLNNVSASLSVIDRQAITNVLATHINELMARTPGAWISRGNGQESLVALRSPVFTGAGSCGSFYMAEDGIPLRPAGFCNVNQLFEANSEQAQRVEILRGPGTALHGGSALHGVINVISQAASPTTSTALRLEGGPHDYARISASHSQPFGEHALRVSANAAHDGGYKDDSGYDQQKMTLRHEWSGQSVAVTNVLSAANLNQETAGYLEGKNAYKDHSRKRDNADPEAFRDNTAVRFYSRWQLPAENGHWQITPFLRHQRMDFLQHFLPGDPLEQNGLDSAGWQLARYWQGDRYNFVAGVDGEYTDAYLKETQVQPVGFSPVFPLGKHYDYEVEALHGAAFGQADWQLDSGTRLSAGLRLEQQRYDYDNRMLDGSTAADGAPCMSGGSPVPCRFSRPADRDDNFTNHSVNLGLIQPLTEQQELVVQLSRGFRAPEAAELYRLQQNQTRADLDSERMDSLELGWRWRSSDLSVNLTGFAMRKRDVIFQDSERRNISEGKTEHYGLELELSWQLSEHWQLAAQGSWARHRYADNVQAAAVGSPELDIKGNDIDTAPHHLGSVQLRWNPLAATRVELEWVHMGSYYLDLENQHSYAGHDLVHLRLRQQLSPGISIGLRLMNLTDEDYAERADHAFGEYRYFVGEPRALYADIAFNF